MIDYNNPNLIIETAKVEPGKIAWRSPSNIALIKYWGKHGRQLPSNPSISFTLDHAFTETTLEYTPKTGADQGVELEFFFHKEKQPAFREKILKFLESIHDIFPFLRQLNLTIRSGNSFPHSAGIASSASSMSALALCLCSLEHELFGTLESDQDFHNKASYIARLGSGSACRSIYSHLAVWGKTSIAPNSSDEYAVEYSDVNDIYKSFQDSILIVSAKEKSVSSRAGHALMDNNVFAKPRFEQARMRLSRLSESLKNGDLETFGTIVEDEALTLHALMMASTPSYLLMEPNSLNIINEVRAFRAETNLPLYFTLDAGPNIHLLYPGYIRDKVLKFQDEVLLPFCEDRMWIDDHVGIGPIELDSNSEIEQ